jgi:hypothetical protein
LRLLFFFFRFVGFLLVLSLLLQIVFESVERVEISLYATADSGPSTHQQKGKVKREITKGRRGLWKPEPEKRRVHSKSAQGVLSSLLLAASHGGPNNAPQVLGAISPPSLPRTA